MTKPTDEGRRAAGRAVLARRGELGLTQAQLAGMADVDIKTVYALEAGGRWPIARNLAAIARALGISADDLRDLAEEGSEPAQAAS
jgi:transcriptional regulator with XRE-family HTH domain